MNNTIDSSNDEINKEDLEQKDIKPKDIEPKNENSEKVEEIKKPTIPKKPVSRVPSFPNPNNFSKWGFNNNFNSKQRPGRAASRWR